MVRRRGLRPAPRQHAILPRALAGLLVGAVCLLLLAGTAPAASPGRRLAVVVGIGHFADSRLRELRYAREDALLVRDYLLDPEGGGFDPADVTLLLDRDASLMGLLSTAGRLVRRAGPQDTVFVYFSTHGYFTRDRQVGICLYDTRTTGLYGPAGPIIDGQTALTSEFLYRFLDSLSAERRVVIADICHSAATVLGACPVYSTDQLTPKGGADWPPESEAEAGPDPNAGPGAVEGTRTLILASSLAREKAWESRQLGASIFTYYLLEGLRKERGDLVAAFAHARGQTMRQSQGEKGWCQTPYLVASPPWARIVLKGGGG